ncbi:MAG: hypothetical protein ACYDDA_12635 [Acidiferrobacteraceae bacterium]
MKEEKELVQHVFFIGTLTTDTPLATTLPDSAFGKGPTAKVARLPRLGEKEEKTRVFYPGSGFAGRFRRCARNAVRDALVARGNPYPFDMQSYFMMSVGGVDGFATAAEGLSPQAAMQLRVDHPFESVFGSERMSARFGIGNAYLTQDLPGVKPPVQNGVRTFDMDRDPGEWGYMAPEEQVRIRARLATDHIRSLKFKEAMVKVKERRAEAKQAPKGSEEQTALFAEATAMEQQARLEKQTGSADEAENADKKPVSVKNPFPGFEFIPEGVVMTHKMSAVSLTDTEAAFLFAAMRGFGDLPRIGGHWHQDCGWVSISWQVKIRHRDDGGRWVTEDLGTIEISRETGMVVNGDPSGRIAAWLDRFDAMARDGFPGIKFDGVQPPAKKGADVPMEEVTDE